MKLKHLTPSGIAALVIVIMVSAVALLLATTATLTGLEETQARLYQTQSKQVLAAAEGCLEEALFTLNGNHEYTGGTLILQGVSCTISVTGLGTARQIDLLAESGVYTRHLQAQVDWGTNFELTDWKELSN